MRLLAGKSSPLWWMAERTRSRASLTSVSASPTSVSKPIWRVSLLTNLPLLLVVVLSFALQFWSQHNALLGGFLKISPLPTSDFLVLLVVGAIPLAVLELVKVVRPARHS